MAKKRLIQLAGGGLAVAAVLGVIGIAWQSRQAKPGTDLHQDILASAREVSLTYSDRNPSVIREISDFEEGHDDVTWRGSGFYDDRVVLAGRTSLSLTSTNHEPGVAYVDTLAPLNQFAHLEVAVKVTDPHDLESLTVFAGSPEHPQAYSFLISNLSEEWNIIQLAREKFVRQSGPGEPTSNKDAPSGVAPAGPVSELPWDQVTRLEFRLISRPTATIIANFDGLRLETDARYHDDWNTNVLTFIGLGEQDGVVHLLARGVGAQIATMHAITAAKNYTYQAKLIPRTDKRAGLFFRGDFRSNDGYVFWVGGVDQSTWGMFTRSSGLDEALATDQLTNIQFREKEPIWLRVQINGENISLFISLDGEHFTKLQDVVDTTFADPGGVGIYVEGGGEVLFNDFMFSQ